MRISRPHLAAFAVLLALALASIATGRQSRTDTEVLPRVTTMNAARTALMVLGKMASGRTGFNRVQANAARHELLTAIRVIPRRFRKPDTDPATEPPTTRARPEIWTRWDEFSTEATSAKRAARALRVYSLPALQSTLPRLLGTCLACHRTFRIPEG